METLDGFNALDEDGSCGLRRRSTGLAMDEDDIAFCQKYFRDEERRDPTITEIRMIDTYWSDHCRHTTFLTEIDDADIRRSRGARTASTNISTSAPSSTPGARTSPLR